MRFLILPLLLEFQCHLDCFICNFTLGMQILSWNFGSNSSMKSNEVSIHKIDGNIHALLYGNIIILLCSTYSDGKLFLHVMSTSFNHIMFS
jgi:hypothetical protein